MRQINLKKFEKIKKHENEKLFFDREGYLDKIKLKLEKLSGLNKFLDGRKVCYVFGMGAHPKSTYKSLENKKGIELIWKASLLPSLLRPLSLIIASYTGLIKINSMSELPDIFMKLSEKSMVGLYVFDNVFELDFVTAIKRSKSSVQGDFIVKSDPGYFIYQVDADNFESSTGIYEIVSLGIECQEKFESIVS